jgi:uncharacterized protein YdeI (YjbR/CyaY-like superfamily)
MIANTYLISTMPELKITSLQELRDWLENNYNTKESLWLVFPKKINKSDFAWAEIVDVLLCYGWIDSVGRKVDNQYTSLRITPRNPKSNWSRVNKNKVAKLTALGLIHPNGQKMIDLAKQSGTWTALDDVEDLILPPDLLQYLEKNSLVESWNAKNKSFKRGFLEQLLNSKKSETRVKKMNDFH